MSGQWEVVRGKNDRRSKVPVPKAGGNQTESKKSNFRLSGVKIDEVLPKSQVQNLYSGKHGNKENKPEEKTKPNESKKPSKKPSSKPLVEPSKPKPPKSVEAGLLAINHEDFSLAYEHSKSSIQNAPIVWLKELTLYLNREIPLDIQDPVFSSKPVGYPLNVVPSNIKSTIEKAVKEAGKINTQLYFDIALTSMVTDLSKGLPVMGYRLVLQYIALSEPKLVTDNIHKHVSLRNSYQNRANVALSILWAVGHVGMEDLQSGLKVFEELMLPLLDMKSYSRYVIKYLLELISRNRHAQLSTDQYLLVLDTVFSKKKNFPSDLHNDLVQNLLKLKPPQLSGASVELFLKKIASNNNQTYQRSLCDVIVHMFVRDPAALASWNKIYTKNLLASAVLLGYISDNYGDIRSNLRRSLKDLLASFETINNELSSKKRPLDGLKEAIAAVKKAQERKQVPRRTRGLFRRLLSVVFLIVYLAVVLEPFYRPSKPRNELCLFRIASRVGNVGLWFDAKLDEALPKPYYSQAKDQARPYGALLNDVSRAFINLMEAIRKPLALYVNEKYPVVVASIDNYAPGLIDNTQVIFKDVFATTTYYYKTGVTYLQKEVFVGQLSPENIQQAVVRAYNTTSEKAIEYYHWVSEKVQTSIK